MDWRRIVAGILLSFLFYSLGNTCFECLNGGKDKIIKQTEINEIKENGEKKSTIRFKAVYKKTKKIVCEDFFKKNTHNSIKKIEINGKEIDLDKFRSYSVDKESETLDIVISYVGFIDLGCMFRKIESLEKFSFEQIDTESVETMLGMFLGCSSLKSLDMDKVEMRRKVNVRWMFHTCDNLNLENLNLWKGANKNDGGILGSLRIPIPYNYKPDGTCFFSASDGHPKGCEYFVKKREFPIYFTSEKDDSIIKILQDNGLYRTCQEEKDAMILFGGRQVNKPSVESYNLKNINRYKRIDNGPLCLFYFREVLGKADRFPYIGNKLFTYDSIYYMKNKYSDEFNFIPNTWCLNEIGYCMPGGVVEFFDHLKNLKKENKLGDVKFVYKKGGKNRGQGVKIKRGYKKGDCYLYGRPYDIVSEYIEPHLIFGKKSSMRLYCLVTSLDPLCVYFYDEGFVIFATENYLKEDETLSKYMHLTNHCINKENVKGWKQNDDVTKFAESYATISSYKKYLSDNKIVDPDVVFSKIKDIVVKSVLAYCERYKGFLQSLQTPSCKNFFSLIGVDIMLDENLKPYLLELNCNPSILENDKILQFVDTKMFVDALNIIGVRPSVNCKNGYLNNGEENLKDCVEEYERYKQYGGGFELLFPTKDSIQVYEKFMKAPSNLTKKFWEYVETH